MTIPKYPGVTILLQGVIHKDICLRKTLLAYTNLCNVVLSIYDTDLPYVSEITKDLENITFVINTEAEFKEYIRNKTPSEFSSKILSNKYRHRLNQYFQVLSIQKALSYITTEYVIKSRVDHYYERIETIIIKGIETRKIISSSLYVRGPQNGVFKLPYHLSDCLFMLRTTELNKLVPLAFQYWVLDEAAEVNLWRPYLQKILNIPFSPSDLNPYINGMMRHIEIVPFEHLWPYSVKLGGSVYTDMKRNEMNQHDYFKYGI